MKGESCVTGTIIVEPHSSDIQADQMEDESCVTRSIIDEPQSWDIEGDQMEVESKMLLEVSSMNLILGMSKEIKLKVKASCYSKYH